MIGNFCQQEGMRGFAAGCTDDKAGAGVPGKASLQIRQIEGGLSITPIRGSQQGEQGLILSDGHRLAIAHGPAFGCKVEGKNPDFGKKWLGHKFSFLTL
jgi:hypothetical protein